MNEIRPKKALGQHWLTNEAALEAMCNSADVGPEDTVLEVGPGQGSLTRILVKRAKQVVAVEFDRDLAEDLIHKVMAPNLTVVQGDILRFDLTSLPTDYKVVANIPYYLTSNLLRVLCESNNPFSLAALLLQKEVAERVVAKPGKMSLLSVSVQFYCEASLGMVIPRRLFTPPPKVDSQILILTKRREDLSPDADRAVYFRVVKAGFSQRRKTLLNSLSAGLDVSKSVVQGMLESAKLSPALRAQSLSLDDWYELYQAYKKIFPENT